MEEIVTFHVLDTKSEEWKNWFKEKVQVPDETRYIVLAMDQDSELMLYTTFDHVPTFEEIIDVPGWVLIFTPDFMRFHDEVWDVFGLPQYVMPVEEEENE